MATFAAFEFKQLSFKVVGLKWMKEWNKISLINKTDFGNEKNWILVWTVWTEEVMFPCYSKQFCRNCGFCWNCSVCPWEVSEGETEDLPLRLLGGLFAINIAHIPATNWIRTIAFLVESSFNVLLESYVVVFLVSFSHARPTIWSVFLRAHGSFFLFWSCLRDALNIYDILK